MCARFQVHLKEEVFWIRVQAATGTQWRKPSSAVVWRNLRIVALSEHIFSLAGRKQILGATRPFSYPVLHNKDTEKAHIPRIHMFFFFFTHKRWHLLFLSQLSLYKSLYKASFFFFFLTLVRPSIAMCSPLGGAEQDFAMLIQTFWINCNGGDDKVNKGSFV